MNLIDRDELINDICKKCNSDLCHDGYWGCEELYVIEAQPTVTVNEWIPVSERLPDESGKYYVARDFWGEHIQYEVMRFHAPINGWSAEHDNIIAWKPIEPYEVNND